MNGASRFEYVTYIRATAEQVWQGLTQPEFTRRYWAETWQESAWTVGAPWRVMIPGGRLGDSGEILEIDPPRKLALTLRVEFIPELKAEGHSRVAYLLEPQETCVKLSFEQVMDRPDSRVIAVMAEGWPMLFASLKSLLETGEPLAETTRWPEGM